MAIVGCPLSEPFIKLAEHKRRTVHDVTAEHTFDARLKCFALSRSISWCERIGSLSSLLTTIPGPSVAGPPEKTKMRAPVLGKVDYNS